MTAGDVGTQAVWCSNLGEAAWWFNRTESCISGLTITYQIIDVQTGAILGQATFDVAHDVDAAPISGVGGDILENSFLTQTSGDGQAERPTVVFKASCTAPCRTYDGDGYSGPMNVGRTEEALFSYTDNPSAVQPDTFRTRYTFTVVPPPGVVVGEPATWEMPVTIRCDRPVNLSPGCVFPEYTPTLVLSLSVHRAAAVTVLFGQRYLPDGWGLNTPLTRRADKARQDSNRAAICEDGSFVREPSVPRDSCDEYAFAASRQSGAEFGLTGISCAEILPYERTNGTWDVLVARYNGTERCVRAHVPLPENEAVGSALGVFTLQQRLLDNDEYLVAVGA